MPNHILIVDDEPAILDTLSGILQDESYEVSVAKGGQEALKFIRADSPPDLVLLDIWMPDLDGIATLQHAMEAHPRLLVIMMSGHGSIESAVKAIKLGAYDYIEKPLSLEKVTLLVRHALHERRLELENRDLRERAVRRFKLVGDSVVMVELRRQIATAGPAPSRVLISGENGTGKELVARGIHFESPRADKPFIEVNCAAIPETLIESELFGHEKGAFTGATATRRGQFELADGGTLFLDEVGDMSLATQAKVLRVLQEQRFQRVGGTRPINVDVRVIAASNKNLTEAIRRGTFREDLYFRLAVLQIAGLPLHADQHGGAGPAPARVLGGSAGRPAAARLAGERAGAAQSGRAGGDHGARTRHPGGGRGAARAPVRRDPPAANTLRVRLCVAAGRAGGVRAGVHRAQAARARVERFEDGRRPQGRAQPPPPQDQAPEHRSPPRKLGDWLHFRMGPVPVFQTNLVFYVPSAPLVTTTRLAAGRSPVL